MSEAKLYRKTWKQRQLLSESGFVLYISPPLFSHERSVKKTKLIGVKSPQSIVPFGPNGASSAEEKLHFSESQLIFCADYGSNCEQTIILFTFPSIRLSSYLRDYFVPSKLTGSSCFLYQLYPSKTNHAGPTIRIS